MKYECKAHMQVWALLSQLHRHKEALTHAKVAISISHYLIKDVHKLIKYYVDRMNTKTNEQTINLEEENNEEGKDSKSGQNRNKLSSKKHIDFLYDPQLSLLAKTAIKLLPIAEELENRLVSEKLIVQDSFDDNENEEVIEENWEDSKPKISEEFNTVFDKVDMRNLLGYLNQSDWIWSLNIGNIMQISPLTMQDIYTTSSIEYELSRELVLEKICFLAVSYFWVSTELRFIVQMKQDDEVADPVMKRKESEFFHGKALDIAAGFLPSECPLVNHILMSYQKHHAPSQQVIQENEEYEEDLKVIRPLQGIESNKHQPIVRANHNLNVHICIVPLEVKPIIYPFHLERIMNIWNHKTSLPQKARVTHTAVTQTTIQHPNSSPGIHNKFFSLKNSKKNGMSYPNKSTNLKKRWVEFKYLS